MAPDQSDRYYYRLQDEADEVYSPGWAGVPHRLGVNGGVLLLHAARARQTRFAEALAAVTHHGAAERQAGRLSSFCDLAEQDTLNYAIALSPAIWAPLDCTWNYMATGLGGHALVTDREVALNFYDACERGARGWKGGEGDLLRCSCGRQVGVLHFAGGVRGSPLLRELNATIVGATGDELRALAERRRERPAARRVARSGGSSDESASAGEVI